jgi:hypothetical protein
MRSRPVAVVGVIVPGVFMHVQHRGRRRRHDERLSKHERDETSHGDSLLRAYGDPVIVPYRGAATVTS